MTSIFSTKNSTLFPLIACIMQKNRAVYDKCKCMCGLRQPEFAAVSVGSERNCPKIVEQGEGNYDLYVDKNEILFFSSESKPCFGKK